MSTAVRDNRAVTLLSALIVTGAALLAIPFFLTPPAYLDLAVRDAVFTTDLSMRQATIVDEKSGKTRTTAIEKIGSAFVARAGRINSGAGSFTARIAGYKPRTVRIQPAALQALRVPVDLTPDFGRLELTLADATRKDEPFAANVKEGTREITHEPQRTLTLDLPPGRHHFSADAPGYCHAERDFEVQEGKITKAAFPLSPDLTDDEVARFVLGWRNEPRDLDTHFWKSDAVRFPSPMTVYFGNKTGVLANGDTFAHLDVDQLYPGAYETLTVRKEARGTYRYFVHVYQGSGTIADADASIQVYTRGCAVRTFVPPPNCSFRIWQVAVFNQTDGEMTIEPAEHCEPEGTTIVRK